MGIMGIVTECRHGRYLYGDCYECDAEKKKLKVLDKWGFKI